MKNYHFIINDDEFRPIYFKNVNNIIIDLRDYAINSKGKVYNIKDRNFEAPVRTSKAYSYVLNKQEVSVRELLKKMWSVKTTFERTDILNALIKEYDLKKHIKNPKIEKSFRFYGTRLRLIMDFKKVSNKQLAYELGIPINNIDYYRDCKKEPNSLIISRLAYYFKIDRAFFENEDYTLELNLKLTENKYDIFYNE